MGLARFVISILCRRGRSGFRSRGRDPSGTVVTQKLLDCLGSDRSGIQVALSQFAANIFEHVRLRLCFYAFGNDLQAETVGEHDNDANDFMSFGVRVHARDESTVDLESVYGKTLQAAEGRVAGTEVVDVQTNPESL